MCNGRITGEFDPMLASADEIMERAFFEFEENTH
jgi:hypothetical protein